MMPVLLSNRSRRPAGTVTPTWFLGTMASVSPGNLRALWLPTSADTTTNVSRSDLRVWTYDADISARISAQGSGVLVSFNGTDQYATTPDTADLSFGNGTTDSPFSIVALASATDTAAVRTMVSRWSAAKQEWNFEIRGDDKLYFFLKDVSAAAEGNRASNAAVTQAANMLLHASYDGSGGATALSGVTLYQNGAVIASTATNNAGYVAMENAAQATDLGRAPGASWNGSMGFVAVYAVSLSTAQHLQIKTAVNKFYGLSL